VVEEVVRGVARIRRKSSWFMTFGKNDIVRRSWVKLVG